MRPIQKHLNWEKSRQLTSSFFKMEVVVVKLYNRDYYYHKPIFKHHPLTQKSKAKAKSLTKPEKPRGKGII